jgi:hypothetical protein
MSISEQVSTFMAELSDNMSISAAALNFLILTATRTNGRRSARSTAHGQANAGQSVQIVLRALSIESGCAPITGRV